MSSVPALADVPASERQHLLRRLGRPASYLQRALRAAAYPLQGIWLCARHPEFWPLFSGRLIPLCVISFLVYFVLFTFTFIPQYLFLAIFHGWGAWVNATFLVLGEGLVITQGLFEGFFVDEVRVDVFDATLIDKGLIDLVAPHRVLFPDAPNAVQKLGKPTARAEYQPWSLVQMVELVVFLPLNLIPYVGAPAFILITGTRLGKLSHFRWFQLRGLDRKARRQEIKTRTWDYVWFGTVAMLAELVPVLSFFFLLTTAAGSALWVADVELEAKQRALEGEAPAQHNVAGSGSVCFYDDPV